MKHDDQCLMHQFPFSYSHADMCMCTHTNMHAHTCKHKCTCIHTHTHVQTGNTYSNMHRNMKAYRLSEQWTRRFMEKYADEWIGIYAYRYIKLVHLLMGVLLLMFPQMYTRLSVYACVYTCTFATNLHMIHIVLSKPKSL